MLTITTTPCGVDLGVMPVKYSTLLRPQELEPQQMQFRVIRRKAFWGILLTSSEDLSMYSKSHR